jgi:hypothetical protein
MSNFGYGFLNGDFICKDNKKLRSLKDLPYKIMGRIYCTETPNLVDFSYLSDEMRNKLIMEENDEDDD